MTALTYQAAQRSTRYFGEYEYSGHFHVSNVNLIRDLSERSLRATVQHRNSWGTWRNWARGHRPSETELQQLIDMIDPLTAVKTHSKLMFYTHWLYVYTNDPNTLSWLAQHDTVSQSVLYRAELSMPTDVIFLREPRHPWRSYFRTGWLTPDQHRALLRFVQTRPDNFYITPGFQTRLETAQHRVYVQQETFIEHSTMQDLTMLGLILPQSIRRTVRVEAK